MGNHGTDNKKLDNIENIRSSLEIEYSEIHNFLRYLLDYRAKIFNFAIVITAATLTLVFANISNNLIFPKILLSVLGLGTSLSFLFAEKRTIFVFYQYLTYAKVVESKLGVGVLSSVRTEVESSWITLRRCFTSIYCLMIAIWLIVLIYFCLKLL